MQWAAIEIGPVFYEYLQGWTNETKACRMYNKVEYLVEITDNFAVKTLTSANIGC